MIIVVFFLGNFQHQSLRRRHQLRERYDSKVIDTEPALTIGDLLRSHRCSSILFGHCKRHRHPLLNDDDYEMLQHSQERGTNELKEEPPIPSRPSNLR